MSELVWTPVRVRIGDLRPWERNPRQMRKEQAKRLLQSWREFGQVQTIAIGPNNEVYDGHQRLSALKTLYGEDYEVLALRASRPLTEEERQRLVLLLHAGAMGEWDWDELANWDPSVLLESGLDESYLEVLERDAQALRELIGLMEEAAEEEEVETIYTKRVDSPIYEPSGEPPPLSECYDLTQYMELVRQVEAEPSLSEEERAFLLAAAGRFVELRFDKIADYYAHARPEVQRLMEALALVVVDYDQAVERGFVRLTERMRRILEEEGVPDE